MSRHRRAAAIALAIAGIALCVAPVTARVWKPTPVEQISDYLFIVDPKEDGSQVMLFWMAPQLGGDPQEQAQLRGLLRNHLLLGVAEVDIKDGSSFMPRRISEPQVSYAGRPRRAIEQGAFPPELQRATDQARGLIGAAGQAFRFFAYPDLRVDACSKGVLQVRYEREVYSYRLPAPGCAVR